jgi:hypothetical protein
MRLFWAVIWFLVAVFIFSVGFVIWDAHRMTAHAFDRYDQERSDIYYPRLPDNRYVPPTYLPNQYDSDRYTPQQYDPRYPNEYDGKSNYQKSEEHRDRLRRGIR